MTLDMIEANAFQPKRLDLTEKLSNMNQFFTSRVTSEKGFYGVTETIKDNGVIERLGVNESGHKVKEYFSNGQIYLQRELLGDKCNATTYYDDNGVAYLQKVTKLGDSQAKVMSTKLLPNRTITRGNFTAQIDAYSRPVLNKVTDLQLRAEDVSRKSLSSIEKTDAYKPNDHKGHLIADSLGGPAKLENIVPQLDKVNQGKMAQVENVVRELKSQGHTVDYEVKANYIGSNQRPSSFEPKITVDGQEYTELPAELKKIYNNASDSTLNKVVTNVGERFGLANELGVKSGLVAAGLTFSVSAVENISSYLDGEITAEDMVVDIAKDSATAGGIAYGTTFVSVAVSQTMSKASSSLIQKIGGSCAPAAVVSFAVESYGDISQFAQGNIDSKELAYNLGDHAASIAGGIAGTAAASAMLGSVAGPAGTVVGFAGGIVGGVIGCAITSEAYKTALDAGAEGAEALAEKAEQFAHTAVDTVAEIVPEQLDNVKAAFNDFASEAKLPFSI